MQNPPRKRQKMNEGTSPQYGKEVRDVPMTTITRQVASVQNPNAKPRSVNSTDDDTQPNEDKKSNATTEEEDDPHSIHAQLLRSRDDPIAYSDASSSYDRDSYSDRDSYYDTNSDDDFDRRDTERRRQVDYNKFDLHEVTVKGENVPPAIELFSECLSPSNINKPLLDNMEREQFTKPTPIQKHCIPLLLKNRNVMAIAQSGVGKTHAVIIPIVAQLLLNGEVDRPFFAGKRALAQPLALLLAPTRELAIQMDENVYKVKRDSCQSQWQHFVYFHERCLCLIVNEGIMDSIICGVWWCNFD